MRSPHQQCLIPTHKSSTIPSPHTCETPLQILNVRRAQTMDGKALSCLALALASSVAGHGPTIAAPPRVPSYAAR